MFLQTKGSWGCVCICLWSFSFVIVLYAQNNSNRRILVASDLDTNHNHSNCVIAVVDRCCIIAPACVFRLCPNSKIRTKPEHQSTERESDQLIHRLSFYHNYYPVDTETWGYLIWIQRGALQLGSDPLNKSTLMCSKSFTFDFQPCSRKQKIHSSPLGKGHAAKRPQTNFVSVDELQLHNNSWIIPTASDMDFKPSAPPALQNHFANGMHQMGSELLGKRRKKKRKLFCGELQIIHFANTDLREPPLMLSRAPETL